LHSPIVEACSKFAFSGATRNCGRIASAFLIPPAGERAGAGCSVQQLSCSRASARSPAGDQNALAILPQFPRRAAERNFEQGFQRSRIANGDWAGIGFGLSVLLLVSLVAGRVARGKASY